MKHLMLILPKSFPVLLLLWFFLEAFCCYARCVDCCPADSLSFQKSFGTDALLVKLLWDEIQFVSLPLLCNAMEILIFIGISLFVFSLRCALLFSRKERSQSNWAPVVLTVGFHGIAVSHSCSTERLWEKRMLFRMHFQTREDVAAMAGNPASDDKHWAMLFVIYNTHLHFVGTWESVCLQLRST